MIKLRQTLVDLWEPLPVVEHADADKWSALLAVAAGCGLPFMAGVLFRDWSVGRTLGYFGVTVVYVTVVVAMDARRVIAVQMRRLGWPPLVLLGLLGTVLQAISGDTNVQSIVYMVPIVYAAHTYSLRRTMLIAAMYLGLMICALAVAYDGFARWFAAPLAGHSALMGFMIAFSRLSASQIQARERADRLAADLAHQRDDLQRLVNENARLYAQASLSATLAERNRLARDLHDTIAQGLTAIAMQLEAAQRSFDRDLPRTRSRVVRAHELARETLQDVRRSVWDLAAPLIDGAGLHTALAEQVERFTARSIVAASYTHTGPSPTLDSAQAMQVVRIVQEALTNAEKHAQAQQLTVATVATATALSVVIEDNGRGFDPVLVAAPNAQGQGFGLRSLHERAYLAGGSLQITSCLGVGTRLELHLPASQPATNALDSVLGSTVEQ